MLCFPPVSGLTEGWSMRSAVSSSMPGRTWLWVEYSFVFACEMCDTQVALADCRVGW
jgi:hypothetical protein